jgi:beta-glucosidase
MVGTFLSKSLLLLQLVSALSTGQAASTPLYKDASASVEDRVSDLLGRMTIEDKMAQLMQGSLMICSLCFYIVLFIDKLIGLVAGDITNWMNSTSGAFNYTGLVENMKMKAGSFYGRETGS